MASISSPPVQLRRSTPTPWRRLQLITCLEIVTVFATKPDSQDVGVISGLLSATTTTAEDCAGTPPVVPPKFIQHSRHCSMHFCTFVVFCLSHTLTHSLTVYHYLLAETHTLS